MPHKETTRYDRYSLEIFSQHCGNYLRTYACIERERVPKVRAELRELAQSHANAKGHEVEITFRVT
jgi:hypothetical protein